MSTHNIPFPIPTIGNFSTDLSHIGDKAWKVSFGLLGSYPQRFTTIFIQKKLIITERPSAKYAYGYYEISLTSCGNVQLDILYTQKKKKIASSKILNLEFS